MEEPGRAIVPGGPAAAADPDRLRRVREILADAVRAQEALHAAAEPIVRSVGMCWQALAAGGRVLVFGNGGSAAEAQHFAADLTGRFGRERRALGAIALTTDTSALTAIGNDYGFARVFARQIEALGRPGDVAVGISTSGRSPNVVEGLRRARELGLGTIALTGPDPADLAVHADLVLPAAGATTARVQEAHLTVLHIICELVEAALPAESPAS